MHERSQRRRGFFDDYDSPKQPAIAAAAAAAVHTRRRRRAGQSGTRARWQTGALLLPLLSLLLAAQPGASQFLPPLPPLGFFGGLLNGFGTGAPSPAIVTNPPAPPAASIAAASDLVPGQTQLPPSTVGTTPPDAGSAANRPAAGARPAGMQPRSPNIAAQPQPAATPVPQAVPVPVNTPVPGAVTDLP